MFISSCDAPTQPQDKPETQILPIPTHGVSPLPVDPTGPQTSSPNSKSNSFKQSKLRGSWLLKQYLETHPEHPYIAIIGIWHATKKYYTYKSIPLKFSPRQIQKSKGKLAYFYYNLSDTSGTTLRNLAGVLPATLKANKRMVHWLEKVGKKGIRQTNEGQASANVVIDPVRSTLQQTPMHECDESGDWDTCSELDDTVVTAPAPDDNDDQDDNDHTWPLGEGPWPQNDGDNQGGHGRNGGSSGTDNSNEDNCTSQAAPGNVLNSMPLGGDDDPYPGPSDPPPPCEDEEDNSTEDMFKGKIITADLKDHPKANCVYQKLDQTKTMQSVVSKFAGEKTNFDLTIVVRDTKGYGELDSAPGIDTFYMRLDEEGILQRKSIETAVLFLHEAIHAEMRRYLRGATDESTLPGFPGNFTHDWKLFVNELYGGNAEAAEHEATAVKYRDVIVEGLKEYNNRALNTDEYRALAWQGLSDTKYYRDVLSDDDKQAIVDNRESALYKSAASCN